MGALANGVCHVDAQAAAVAVCAELAGVSSAGVVSCQSVGGTSGAPVFNMLLSPNDGGTATSYEAPFGVVACDQLEPYTDAAALTALLLVALLGVYLAKQFVLRLVMPQ